MEDSWRRLHGVAEDQIQWRSNRRPDCRGREIAEWTEGTRDPDYEALLAPFGVNCARRPDVDAAHFALLGMKAASANRECKMTHVFDGSPAQAAGLSANDVLVALVGGRARCQPGHVVVALCDWRCGRAVAFRRDELMRFQVKLATPAAKFQLEDDQKSARAAQQLRRGWIGRLGLRGQRG